MQPRKPGFHDVMSGPVVPAIGAESADRRSCRTIFGNVLRQLFVCSDEKGVAMETTWMTIGNCNTLPPATFFPSDGVGVEVARKICATCPVKEPCLEYALQSRIDHGVWGGCSERERRRILKRRRVTAGR
jgi:WhiB family redox-sensing transcriptional regulator